MAYPGKMPQLHYDDEGNGYSPDEVMQGVRDMLADEDAAKSGTGSMGGLQDSTGKFGGTSHEPRLDYSDTGTQAQRPEGATAPPDNAQETAGTKGLTPKEGAAPSPEKKPGDGGRFSGSFGDIIRKNVFGGLNADYVTGKRPMTLWDYATDVASGYGGVNVGKRNAELINQSAQKQKLALETQKTQADLQTSHLNANKAFAGEIQDTFENYDQEQWLPHIKTLAKQAGIDVPPETLQMTQTLLDRLNAAGANASDVMENPDKYDPALVNRLRHTASLWYKHSQDSDKAAAEAAKNKQDTEAKKIQAGGVASMQGLPGVTPAQKAALAIGGAPQTKAAEAILGGAEKPSVESRLQNAAGANLDRRLGKGSWGPSELNSEVERLKATASGDAAARKQAITAVGKIGFQLDSMERFFSDPKYDQATKNVLYSAPNVGGKTVSGELARIPLAVSKHTFQNRLNAGDDDAMYLASVVQTIIPRIRADAAGTEGLRINMSELNLLDQGASQLKEGHMTAQNAAAFKRRAVAFINQTRQGLEEYKNRYAEPAPAGTSGGAPGTGTTAGAPDDRQAMRAAIGRETDPAKKAQMAREYQQRYLTGNQ